MQLKDSVCEFCPINQFSDATGQCKVCSVLNDHHILSKIGNPLSPVPPTLLTVIFSVCRHAVEGQCLLILPGQTNFPTVQGSVKNYLSHLRTTRSFKKGHLAPSPLYITCFNGYFSLFRHAAEG